MASASAAAAAVTATVTKTADEAKTTPTTATAATTTTHKRTRLSRYSWDGASKSLCLIQLINDTLRGKLHCERRYVSGADWERIFRDYNIRQSAQPVLNVVALKNRLAWLKNQHREYQKVAEARRAARDGRLDDQGWIDLVRRHPEALKWRNTDYVLHDEMQEYFRLAGGDEYETSSDTGSTASARVKREALAAVDARATKPPVASTPVPAEDTAGPPAPTSARAPPVPTSSTAATVTPPSASSRQSARIVAASLAPPPTSAAPVLRTINSSSNNGNTTAPAPPPPTAVHALAAAASQIVEQQQQLLRQQQQQQQQTMRKRPGDAEVASRESAIRARSFIPMLPTVTSSPTLTTSTPPARSPLVAALDPSPRPPVPPAPKLTDYDIAQRKLLELDLSIDERVDAKLFLLNDRYLKAFLHMSTDEQRALLRRYCFNMRDRHGRWHLDA